MEAWQPQIGERVRVRVNAECAYCVDADDPDEEALALSQDGRTASVVEISHDPLHWLVGRPKTWDQAFRAHHVWVRFDEPWPTDERVKYDLDLNWDNHFAPQELEPVDDDERLT